MATVTPPRNNRDRLAFCGPNGQQNDGEIPEATCAQAGLHEPGTWGRVQRIAIGDLMLLSGFHEPTGGARTLPQLRPEDKAAIIEALKLHLGMTYYGEYGHPSSHGFHACCTCF